MWRFHISLVALFALSACSVDNAARGPSRHAGQEIISGGESLPPPTQCAPFAREISGIPLRGDAWTWWDQAVGRFDRGCAPRENAVLVLRATDQLPFGHVAVVRHVVGPREITVTHADWGDDDPTRRLVHDAMPVVDVSPANDWSELRFWNVQAQAFGKIYPAYGFIYPQAPTLSSRPIR